MKSKRGKGKGQGKDRRHGEREPNVTVAEVICYYCHRKGHRKRDRRTMEKDRGKKGVNVVEQTPGQAAEANLVQTGMPARISMIELGDWILMINIDEHEAQVGSIERVMVDSGAPASVCPPGYAPETPIANSSRNATSTEMEDGSDAPRPLVAVFELQRRGMTVVMGRHGSFVTKEPGGSLELEHSNEDSVTC